ncbi:BatA and WFA domain-containing protein [Schlesneria sp. T3-172]|uniref:VWA domain-containing protein n=2 Tax=Schlesneria TaxID=656899 RepID=UPI0037C702B2
MTFDSPGSLFWFGLAVPIVVFYILKIRLRRQPVSTILFWNQVLNEQNPRSIWQRLKHLVSLLLQLAMLSLLVLALADPYFFWEVRSARRIVLVVDNSASMNATDVKPSRLSEARRHARLLVSGMRHRDEVALVAAGTQPQVIVGFTGRQRTLTDAINSLPATDGPTRVAEAISLAQRLLGERPDGKQAEVIVLTDGCFEGAETRMSDQVQTNDTSEKAPLPVASANGDAPAVQAPNDIGGPGKLTLQIIGERSGNVGITQFQVRRSLVDPLGYEILAEVSNVSDDPVECRFEIDLLIPGTGTTEPIDVVPLKLEPGAKWTQVFDKASANGGHLVANIKHDDALAADNTAWAVLPRREIQSVILVTTGNLFLQKVFEANPLVKLTVVDQPPASVPLESVVVYHRGLPATLPAGNVFIIDPANSSDLFTVGEQLESAIVTKQDKDSPLMAHVSLDNVVMPEARKITPTEPEQVQILATAITGDPLFFAINRPEGKVLVLTVNLDKGDLPLRTAFPISVGNALHWFAGNKSDLRESLAAGSIATVTISDFLTPPKGQELTLVSPTGQRKPLTLSADKATVGPLDQCGIWQVSDVVPTSLTATTQVAQEAPPPPLLEIACNLASSAESDLRPTEDLLLKRSSPSPVLAGLGSRPVWFWLLLIALALTTIEWCLYQRRVIS